METIIKDGIIEGLPCDNAAIMAGYTQEVYIDTPHGSFMALVKPDTDLTDRFKAWCTDVQEWVYVNGWACECNFC